MNGRCSYAYEGYSGKLGDVESSEKDPEALRVNFVQGRIWIGTRLSRPANRKDSRLTGHVITQSCFAYVPVISLLSLTKYRIGFLTALTFF